MGHSWVGPSNLLDVRDHPMLTGSILYRSNNGSAFGVADACLMAQLERMCQATMLRLCRSVSRRQHWLAVLSERAKTLRWIACPTTLLNPQPQGVRTWRFWAASPSRSPSSCAASPWRTPGTGRCRGRGWWRRSCPTPATASPRTRTWLRRSHRPSRWEGAALHGLGRLSPIALALDLSRLDRGALMRSQHIGKPC